METRLRRRVTQEGGRRQEAGEGLQHRPAGPTEDAEGGQGDLRLGLHLLQMHLLGASSSAFPEDGALLGKPKRRQKDVTLDWPLLTCVTFIHICLSQMGPSVLATPPCIPRSVTLLSQWLSGKESACNAGAMGDAGLIPGWGRSPGGGHGNPLQYSCLENPME